MLETLAVVVIVAAAVIFLGLKLLAPLWRKDAPSSLCEMCATPCSEKDHPRDPELGCSAGAIPNPLRTNVPDPQGAPPKPDPEAAPEEPEAEPRP